MPKRRGGVLAYLHTRVIANFDVTDKLSSGNDNTSTLVSTDKWEFGGQWPVTVDGVEISVADTRVLDVDENLIWSRLLDWDPLVDDSWEESAKGQFPRFQEGGVYV